jgi:hypothetical protein
LFKQTPQRYLVAYLLLACYGGAIAVTYLWPTSGYRESTALMLLWVMVALLGYFGSLSWCIYYLPAEATKARMVLIANVVITATWILMKVLVRRWI